MEKKSKIPEKFDFSGYVTKFGIVCDDGLIIEQSAFKGDNGAKRPLVWQHQRNDIKNIIGDIYLEHRADGVYGRGVFNDTENGILAKKLVLNGNIEHMSIHANRLSQQGHRVKDGMIREVSLVVAGANSGANIEYITIEHGASAPVDELIVRIGGIEHSASEDIPPVPVVEPPVANGNEGGLTHEGWGEEVFSSLTDDQKTLLAYLVTQAAGEGTAEHKEGGIFMSHNIFQSVADAKKVKSNVIAITPTGKELTHDAFQKFVSQAAAEKTTFNQVLQHATEYGIDNIEVFFPDHKTVTPTPDFVKRDTEWVPLLLNGVHKSPFARIKSTSIDLTAPEARAKGYVTGNKKVEEVIKAAKRTTNPTTIYKKQKMDNDVMIDAIDINTSALLQMEMRWMMDEETARAMLVGDGREIDDPDHVNDECIRPIWTDDDFYVVRVTIPEGSTTLQIMDAVMRGLDDYKGAGDPTLFLPKRRITDIMLLRDDFNHRLFKNKQEAADSMGMGSMVNCPIVDGQTRTDEAGNTYTLYGIAINPYDYSAGSDRGGTLKKYYEFDMDFNQHKWLMEHRMSGALRHWKRAVVIEIMTPAASGGSDPAPAAVIDLPEVPDAEV